MGLTPGEQQSPGMQERDEVSHYLTSPLADPKSNPLKLWEAMDSLTARCKLCKRIVKTAGNTSNMAAHMKNNHKSVVVDITQISPSPPSSNQSPTVIPPSPQLMQPSIEDAISAVQAYSAGGSKAEQLDKVPPYWIVRNEQPFSMVEEEGFKWFCSHAFPKYRPPCRTKIATLMDKAYTETTKTWRSKLYMKKVALTTDVWTETMNMKSFLGLTVRELTDTHTAANVGSILTQICCFDIGNGYYFGPSL
ncbi:hypothetical protein ACLKA6_009766 [Drosophila palustris]